MSASNLSGSVPASDETEDAYKDAAGNNYDCLVGIYCPYAGDGTTAYLDAILSTKAFVVTPSNLSDFQSELVQDFGHSTGRDHAASGTVPPSGANAASTRPKNSPMERTGDTNPSPVPCVVLSFRFHL